MWARNFDDDQFTSRSKRVADAEGLIRRAFVRKVYGLLASQLALTLLVAWPIERLGWRLQNMVWLMVFAACVNVTIVLVCACFCMSIARRSPYNYLFLFTMTLCNGIIVGFITGSYSTSAVLLGVGLVSAIVGLLTLLALCVKSDFTGIGPYIFAASMGLMLVGIFELIFWSIDELPWHPASFVYAGIGAILYSYYIILDTQLITKGQHMSRYQYSVDDYAYAALCVYIDIVQIFVFVLELLSARRGPHPSTAV